jgi:hypothetical protein
MRYVGSEELPVAKEGLLQGDARKGKEVKSQVTRK